jgi:hypothetical protein
MKRRKSIFSNFSPEFPQIGVEAKDSCEEMKDHFGFPRANVGSKNRMRIEQSANYTSSLGC